MRQLDTDKPRGLAKALGTVLACAVAIASLVLVAVTQEPKRAVSSPTPARAQGMVPQIADAKSEAEILFRGKSFSVLQRVVSMPFTGEIREINVKEGQAVNRDERLAKYDLHPQARIQVYTALYPERVLTLRNTVAELKTTLDKLTKVVLPVKQIAMEMAQKDLKDNRELLSRQMNSSEAVRLKENDWTAKQKDVEETHQGMGQAGRSLAKAKEDLRFFEEKQKRDTAFLEWQTKRSYTDKTIPDYVGYLETPITGQVVWMSPDLRTDSELPAGSPVFRIAPTTPILVRCKVHELDLVKLKAGDKGVVVFDAIPDKKYQCKISRIPWISRNPALEVPADYEVECVLDSADGRIKDGLTCNVKVSVRE